MGLSFRLSDYQRALDPGNQGYDVILTNDAGGSVQLRKRIPPSKRGDPPSFTTLKTSALSILTNKSYQLSVTAKNDWTATGHHPAYPHWTTITVSLDGNELFSHKDCCAAPPGCFSSSTGCPAPGGTPYFSGRFGVYRSNVEASFTCLQANGPDDSRMPAPSDCARVISTPRPNCGHIKATSYSTCQ